MREDGVAQSRIRQFAHHGDLDLRHEFAAFQAEYRGAEDLVGGGVHDGLHEATRFVHLERSRDVIHRHFGDTDGAVLRAGLLFGQADTTELRINKNGVGNQAVGRGGVAVFQEIGAQDAKIVVRDVGKRGTSLDVAQGVDVLGGSLELVVHANEAAVVSGHSGGEEIQGI